MVNNSLTADEDLTGTKRVPHHILRWPLLPGATVSGVAARTQRLKTSDINSLEIIAVQSWGVLRFPFLIAGLSTAAVAAAQGAPLPTGIVTQVSGAGARAAIEQAAEARVLLWGYFRLVDDPAEIAEVKAQMEGRLRDMGIRASIGRCEWMGVVSNGNASGNRAYGTACRVRIAGRPERAYLLCSSTLGGTTLAAPDVYAHDPEYVELFIRRACF